MYTDYLGQEFNYGDIVAVPYIDDINRKRFAHGVVIGFLNDLIKVRLDYNSLDPGKEIYVKTVLKITDLIEKVAHETNLKKQS